MDVQNRVAEELGGGEHLQVGQGGALLTLADTAVVMAIKSLLAPETYFAAIAREAKYLRVSSEVNHYQSATHSCVKPAIQSVGNDEERFGSRAIELNDLEHPIDYRMKHAMDCQPIFLLCRMSRSSCTVLSKSSPSTKMHYCNQL
jgi:hypothetical protein